MRTQNLRFMAPWIISLALGCGASASNPPATTTPTPSSSETSSGNTATPTTTTTTTTPPETTATATTPATTTTTTTTTTPETTTTTPATATTPATTATASAPPDAAAVARGHRAFDRACATCHDDPNDTSGPNPNKNWEEARMRTQIRSGAGRMRAIPVTRLSDADLTALIAYLRSTHAVR